MTGEQIEEPIVYYVPPYDGQVFPDVLEASGIAPNRVDNQEEVASELAEYFTNRAVAIPAFAGYDKTAQRLLMWLDSMAISSSGHVMDLLGHEDEDVHQAYRFRSLPLHPGWSKEELAAYRRLEHHTEADRQLKYEQSDPETLFGELPVPTQELMQRTYQMLGAKLIRDDIENGNSTGQRVWLGMWKGVRLFVVENIHGGNELEKPHLSWTVEDNNSTGLLTQLSDRDEQFLDSIGVELQSSVSELDVNRTNIRDVAAVHDMDHL